VCAKWNRCWLCRRRTVFLVWWFYDAISLGVFALPATFFLILIPMLGPDRYYFPSEGVRKSWLLAHIAALLLAYAALSFSVLASLLYLVQERRIKSKPRPGKDSWWAPFDWLPPLDTLERIALATLEFGFPCMTVGLVIGSVLVQETPSAHPIFSTPISLPRSSFGQFMLCCSGFAAARASVAARLPTFQAHSLW